MITICPKCALTLAVTAADLRVAQGQVRCGRCLAVFNSLVSLYDDLPGHRSSSSAATQRDELPVEASQPAIQASDAVTATQAPAPDPEVDVATQYDLASAQSTPVDPSQTDVRTAQITDPTALTSANTDVFQRPVVGNDSPAPAPDANADADADADASSIDATTAADDAPLESTGSITSVLEPEPLTEPTITPADAAPENTQATAESDDTQVDPEGIDTFVSTLTQQSAANDAEVSEPEAANEPFIETQVEAEPVVLAEPESIAEPAPESYATPMPVPAPVPLEIANLAPVQVVEPAAAAAAEPAPEPEPEPEAELVSPPEPETESEGLAAVRSLRTRDSPHSATMIRDADGDAEAEAAMRSARKTTARLWRGLRARGRGLNCPMDAFQPREPRNHRVLW